MERNPDTLNIDEADALRIVEMMNDEDAKIAGLIRRKLPEIAKAVELITVSFSKGGRLIYVGSGTSGKLGVMDASECPPTFGVDDSTVTALISGGAEAAAGWLEQTEDDGLLGKKDIERINVSERDTVVAISASGTTPYAVSAAAEAARRGAATVAVTNSETGILNEMADIAICVETGPEVIMGSTRLKAGTAQKMILNMLSTASMIKSGKVYSNLMANVKPINSKLKKRVIKIVAMAVNITEQAAEEALLKSGGEPKTAILMAELGISKEEAGKIIDANNGKISKKMIEGLKKER